MNEHTPTPWTVDPDHRPGMGWNAHVVEANDPNNRVCFMTSGPEGKINAAFIVKAVNSFGPAQDILTDIWFHFSATDDPTLRGIADRARALMQDPPHDNAAE